MAGHSDSDGFPANIESVLKKASDELMANQESGYCFSVDHTDEPTENLWKSAYDKNELAEFVNFEMLGEEDNEEFVFNHLIKDVKHEDILGDGRVIKILLEEG